MNYPIECDTDLKKYKFICIAVEKLRLLQNKMTKWKDAGLKQEQYDSLPLCVREVVKHEAQITEEEWQSIWPVFLARFKKVFREGCTLRATLENNYAIAKEFVVDIDGL